MNSGQSAWRVALIACALVTLLAGSIGRRAVASSLASSGTIVMAADAREIPRSSVDRYVSRLVTRAEHSMARFATVFGRIGIVWLWCLLSAGGFLIVTVLCSVADIRMFELRREGAAEMLRYLAHGTRTFFRILGDRQTPYVARSVLALALVYWFVPLDLIPDDPVLPGFVDDILIAILAAKGFVYLCPDRLIAVHAAEVEAQP